MQIIGGKITILFVFFYCVPSARIPPLFFNFFYFFLWFLFENMPIFVVQLYLANES